VLRFHNRDAFVRALFYTYYYRSTFIRDPGWPRGLCEATVKSVIALLGCTLPSGRVVVAASRNGAPLRKSHRSGAQSKASSSDAPRRTVPSRQHP